MLRIHPPSTLASGPTLLEVHVTLFQSYDRFAQKYLPEPPQRPHSRLSRLLIFLAQLPEKEEACLRAGAYQYAFFQVLH